MSNGSIIFENGLYNSNISKVNADGSGEIKLAESKWVGKHHCVTADGNWLVYADGDNLDRIYAVKTDGSQKLALNTPHYPVGSGLADQTLYDIKSLSVSPDLCSIVFATDAKSSSDNIGICNIDGSNTRLLAVNGKNPSFSPDGKHIAYNADGYIHIMNTDGSNNIVVTPWLDAENPAWSPDGSQIAFDGLDGYNSNIYIISANGLEKFTMQVGDNYDNPSWSPDGKSIVYHTLDLSGHDGIPLGGAIAARNVDGTNIHWVANGVFPVWARDEATAVYTVDNTTMPNKTILWATSTANLNVDLSSTTPYVSSATNSNIVGLVGGSGNDTLKGNSLDNQIWGGAGGNDTLTGGDGADVFWFGKNDGNDVIIASNGSCSVNFYDAKLSDASYFQRNDDLIISLGGTGTLDLQGWYSPTNASSRIMHATFADGTKL